MEARIMKKNVVVKTKQIFRKFRKEYFIPFLFFVSSIIGWQLFVDLFNVHEVVLPSPSAIYQSFLVFNHTVIKNSLITITEIILGFILGGLIGLLFGIGIAYSKILNRILYPLAIFLKVTPIIAIAPLLFIWFGHGIWARIVVVIIGSFFYVIVNTTLGLTSVDPELIDLMRVLTTSEWKIFVKVRLPSALPYIFSAFKISITSCVIGATVAEWVAFTHFPGLGGLTLWAASFYNTPLVFLITVMISLLGILFFGIISFFDRILTGSWAPSQLD